MHYSLILALAALAAAASPSAAHTLMPGRQVVQTMGERAWVRLEAANGRKDVTAFVVEVFAHDRWSPSRNAVAVPSRLVIPATDVDSMEATSRTISVLVDLDGEPEQRIRVCTKSVPQENLLLPQTTRVNTRVCASVTVRKFQP